jgi:SAM-dependent methyltransferase
MHSDSPAAAEECRRIRSEYDRRAAMVDVDRYAPWQPAVALERATRVRVAAGLLHQTKRFPLPASRCLEVGYGSAGWLPDLLQWGVREANLCGVELDPTRARTAQQLLPAADLQVGNGMALPWEDETFSLVVLSTVFSSILDSRMRQAVAREALRVTAPGGAVLCYDLARNNPANRHVRRVTRREWLQLFPGVEAVMRSVTLAPPLARAVAPRSWVLAQLLDGVPFLRTHLIVVLLKH